MLPPARLLAALVPLVALGTAGCTTTVEQSPAGADEARVTRTELLGTWTVRCAGEVRGEVLLFREPTGVRRSIYVVRNRHGQDLGLVDELGRAWRRRVHAGEPDLLGTGDLLTGALRVLGLEDAPSPELVVGLPGDRGGLPQS